MGHTSCSSLTSKEDDDILILLLHSLNYISCLFRLSNSVRSSPGTISVLNLNRFSPKLTLGEVGDSAKSNEDENDEVCCIEHGIKVSEGGG